MLYTSSKLIFRSLLWPISRCLNGQYYGPDPKKSFFSLGSKLNIQRTTVLFSFNHRNSLTLNCQGSLHIRSTSTWNDFKLGRLWRVWACVLGLHRVVRIQDASYTNKYDLHTFFVKRFAHSLATKLLRTVAFTYSQSILVNKYANKK